MGEVLEVTFFVTLPRQINPTIRKLIISILCCISMSCVNNPTDTANDMDCTDTLNHKL